MPQLFQVLRCYKCLVFQVHQTKKSKKFQCKMCGEKQSIKRHYGLGNGLECRLHVQKLNVRRKLTEEECLTSENSDQESDLDETQNHLIPKLVTAKSKWSSYVDDDDDDNISKDEEKTIYSVIQKVSSENLKKRKKYDSTSQQVMLLSQKTFVNKTKFEMPYKCDENVNQTLQDNSKHKNSDELLTKHEYAFSNNLNNACCRGKENSKWSQFVVHNLEPEGNLRIKKKQNLEPSKTNYAEKESSSCSANNLFEQCDDTDLDMILNI